MPSDIREQYEAAWKKLYSLVNERNKVLEELKLMMGPAASLTVATSMVARVDTAKARALLDQVDEFTKRIEAGIEYVNELGGPIAQPEIRWVNMELRK